MSGKVPLERPAPPSVPSRLDWPGRTVAVFGTGATAWAETLREALSGAGVHVPLLRVELRHTPGYALDEGEGTLTVHAHPDALLEALESARGRASTGAITLGVGAAFAAAVDAHPIVWIRHDATLLSLPGALRPVARDADLVLEEPRGGVARALARALADGSPSSDRGW